MKGINNLKFTKKAIAIIAALVTGGYISYNLYKNNEKIDQNTQITTSTSDSSSIDNNNTNNKEYVPDKYEKIRLIEQYANMTPMELDEFLKRYSDYSLKSYDECIEIVEKNLKNIVTNYDNFKEGMMVTIFDEACNDNTISIQDTNNIIIKYEQIPNTDNDIEQNQKLMEQCKKQEEKLLQICDDLEMSSEEKIICASIFRFETGYGNSDFCIYQNNYGGNRVPYSLEYCSFTTAEFGMYYQIMTLKSLYFTRLEEEGHRELYDLIRNISYMYSEVPDTWYERIIPVVEQVESDYQLKEDKLEILI